MAEDSSIQPPTVQPESQEPLANIGDGQRVVQPSQVYVREMNTVPGTTQPADLPQSPQPVKGPQKRRKITLFAGIALLIIIGVVSWFAWDHNDKTVKVTAKRQSSGVVATDISKNPKLASLNTSDWQSYADPTMKLSFKYPVSINVPSSRVKLYPPKPASSPELIKSEVAVAAEIVGTGSFGIVTPIESATLIDIVTYEPGSINDNRESILSSPSEHEIKPMTIDGIKVSCAYAIVDYGGKHTGKSYLCKFHRDGHVYEITGGSKPSDHKNFPDIDIWTISQKILESLQFTN